MELADHHYNLFPTRIWQVELHDLATLFLAWPGIVAAISFNAIAGAFAK